ncbi:FecR family protein [Turneriella parva]|uniref:FecR family protein n=1 Tax=Turneriella parva (strain ATCC BAA-1111 / DSM 21527 / NCTC 11395 / H) TaxID=869212 RepID=I4B7W9_TURPD|nr:FecR domain-containing protein [Turneriella parva]AFM13376.1 FecR family protein [Turneriella parva DSM 21527]
MQSKNLFIAAVALFGTLSLAADAGKLTFVSGQVEIHDGKSWQKAALGALVKENEKIRTGKKGTVIISLKSGAALKLKSDSQIILSAVGASTTIDVESGSIFSKVGKRQPGQTFQIRAQTMVAAVRGTEFYFAFGKKKSDKADLWLCVNEGQVNVVDTSTKSDVNVNAGEGIVIPSSKPIPKPKAYAWTKKLNWNMDAQKGAVEDTTDLKGAYKDLLKHNYD